LSDTTLTVAQILDVVGEVVGNAIPGPVWARGEVSGFHRTSGGAGFFRLVDPDQTDSALEVAASGRIMMAVTHALESAGVGSLRSGIEVRVKGTIGLRRGRGLVQLSLLEVDPAFTAGRLALDRDEVLRRLGADGTLAANAALDVPLVPLRIGLVTSRGSAAHADFLGQLRRPGYGFSVRTVHAAMQGESAIGNIVKALERLTVEDLDVIAMVRGGGAKLDLVAFDSEMVGRAVASMRVPVITGIGHDTDRTVADETAAVPLKTPTAAAEWIVSRVADFAGRVDTARRAIREAAKAARTAAVGRLEHAAVQLAGTRGVLQRQIDQIDNLERVVVDGSRAAIQRRREQLDAMGEMFEAIGVEPTLRRGFAILSRSGGPIVRSAGELRAGDRVTARLADGSVAMVVEE
jgi:exodeoxyribonuclease VII large subunit